VIESGQENAIMPDISEMDRAIGRDNMRQVHVGVDTEDRDTYQGSNVIVAKPPKIPMSPSPCLPRAGSMTPAPRRRPGWRPTSTRGRVGGLSL
jgi:hypothetical protein